MAEMKDRVYFSCDLTAATDRFPIDQIGLVLEGHLPPSYVAAWKFVMVGLPFDFGHTSERYATGNPMGAYSSWASFAVAHHFIVFKACQNVGTSWKECKYCLLGDDIVIANEEVGREYLKLMSRLGIQVNLTKSHISPHFFEFAKRIFWKGVEVSPFPISSLPESAHQFHLMVSLF